MRPTFHVDVCIICRRYFCGRLRFQNCNMDDIKPQLPVETLPSNSGNDEIAPNINNGVPKRVHLPEDEKVEREKFLELWHEQSRYIDHLESKLKVSHNYLCLKLNTFLECISFCFRVTN